MPLRKASHTGARLIRALHVTIKKKYIHMKKIILSVLILGLLVAVGWLVFSFQKKKEATLQAQLRSESIPQVNLNTLSGNTHALQQLSAGVGTVLVYFNSTCEICQLELESIANRLSEFDGAQILLVSSQEQKELADFYQSHPLKSAPNVYWFLDHNMEVAGHYGVRGVPALFCYNSEGKLTAQYQGLVKLDLVLESLGLKNQLKP
jgi:peroxiredoxin